MPGVRQLPQAKYELLTKNKRATFSWYQLFLAVGVGMIMILITSCSVYLAWQNMTYNNLDGFGKVSHHNSKNISGVIERRMALYSAALRQNLNNNIDVSEPHNNVGVLSLGRSEIEAYKLVCYYNLPHNGSGGDLFPEAINPSLCTHINIAFVYITNGSLQPISLLEIEMYKRVLALKSSNPSLKVIISVGGGSEEGGFPSMASTYESRKRFIRDILALLDQCSLDGVDLDWEFPAWQSSGEERTHFTLLLRELREEFDQHHKKPLLTVAVAAPQPIVDKSYDIKEMAKYVDFVNIMCYDYYFYTWYLPVTGFNAPLFKGVNESGYFATLNTNWTISYWLSKGMPKEKIVVGFPTYGHSYTLVDEDNHGVKALASGNGKLGEGGFTSYPQVCGFLADGATFAFDRDCRVPYAFKRKEWVSFDDERSLAYKAQYVVKGGFGGAMVFSLNMDDFKGECSVSMSEQRWFPLTTKVKNVLEDDGL